VVELLVEEDNKMPKAMINLTAQPYRMLSKSAAAEYVGLSAARFSAACPVVPLDLANGVKRWDIRDLDAWLDSLKSDTDMSDEALLSRLG